MTERAERLVQRGCERLPPGGRGGERAVAARAPPPPSRSPPPPASASCCSAAAAAAACSSPHAAAPSRLGAPLQPNFCRPCAAEARKLLSGDWGCGPLLTERVWVGRIPQALGAGMEKCRSAWARHLSACTFVPLTPRVSLDLRAVEILSVTSTFLSPVVLVE